ncbi:MAG: ApaG protein [Abditibacteriota bacterium]|nr:ApaG protein [Abditibacteriota bacterium]
MSVAVTQGIKISVASFYREDESDPRQSQYFFTYEITIENQGDEPAQLLSRHWIIKDAFNRIEEVRGEGVIGQMPVLEPGASFFYRSGCPLRTEFGSMRGTYLMERPNGERFEATIAPFPLITSYLLN